MGPQALTGSQRGLQSKTFASYCLHAAQWLENEGTYNRSQQPRAEMSRHVDGYRLGRCVSDLLDLLDGNVTGTVAFPFRDAVADLPTLAQSCRFA